MHHVGREVLVTEAPETVGLSHDAHARAPELLRDRCCMIGDGGIVIDGFGVHRPDDGQLVGDLRRVRQQFGHPRAGSCRVASERETATRSPGFEACSARSCRSNADCREPPAGSFFTMSLVEEFSACDRSKSSCDGPPCTGTGKSRAFALARSDVVRCPAQTPAIRPLDTGTVQCSDSAAKPRPDCLPGRRSRGGCQRVQGNLASRVSAGIRHILIRYRLAYACGLP